MTIDELKQRIEREAGVPAALLDGETSEECIIKAKALLCYKRDHTPKDQEQKDNKELFADWIRQRSGIEDDQDPLVQAMARIKDIENELRSVPVLQDGGEARLPAYGSAREAFRDWMNDNGGYNPFSSGDGWKPIG